MHLSFSNKYIQAALTNILFFIINTITFLVITPVALKIMDEDFYGLWSILCAIVLFSNIGNLGMGSIVNKFASEEKDGVDRNEYLSQVTTSGFFIVIPMSLLILLILVLIRNILAKALIDDVIVQGQFSIALIVIGLSMVPQFICHVYQGLLLANLQNKIVRTIDLCVVVMLWVGSILTVYFFGKNIIYVAIWCFINSIITLFLYFFAVNRNYLLTLSVNHKLINKMLHFSGFMFLESIAINLFSQIDRVLLGISIGPSLAGVYSIGTSVGSRLTMIVGQVTSVMVPYASFKNSTNNQEKLFITFRKLSKYVSLSIGLFGGLAIIWIEPFLSFWISPNFSQSYGNTFRIFLLAYGLLTLCRPAHQTLTGLGKVKLTSLIYLLTTVGMLIILFWGSKAMGIEGAAWANVFMVLLLVFNFFVYKKYSSTRVICNLIEDLNFGVIIPLLCYLILLLHPDTFFMIVTSLVICFLFGFQLVNDSWVKGMITNNDPFTRIIK